jgi:hypothetical protein
MGGNKNGLVAVHAKLVTSVPELTFLKGRLEGYGAIDFEDAQTIREATQLVAHAEQLCKDVRAWSAEIPGTRTF